MAKPSPLSSLRTRILLLVCIPVLPPLVLAINSGLEHARLQARQVQEDALRLARLAAFNQERLISTAEQLLSTLALVPQVRGEDRQACRRLFLQLLHEYPIYANFGRIELNGDLTVSALPTSGVVNLSDRAYFRRALSARTFAVGDYQIGRVTKKATINFGYPVRDATGRIRWVIFAALDLAWLGQLLAKAELPLGATLTVADRHGVILARSPADAAAIDRPLADAPLQSALSAGLTEGTAEGTAADGERRLYAFTRLPKAIGGALVAVSMPSRVAFAEANRIMRRDLLALGVLALLALVAAVAVADLSILRWVAALVAAARRLADGDLSARTGLRYNKGGELGQLARVLDETAAALEQRIAERDQAEAELRHYRDHLEDLVAARTADLERANHELENEIALRVQAEQALRQSEEKYRTLLENLPQKIFFKDRNSVYVSCNENYARDLGISPAEIAGKTDYDFFPADLAEKYRADDARIMQSREVEDIEERYIQGGRELIVHTVKTPVTDEAGNVVGVLGIFWDVTAQKLAEEELARKTRELERSNADLEQFAYVASHDLREPLRKIIAFGERIQQDCSGQLSDEGREYLSRMLRAAHRMQGLISDLLSYSRVRTRAQPFQPVDLGQVLHDVLADLEVLIEQTGATVRVGPMPSVHADPTQMAQLFQNLISNAIKFRRPGVPPQIEITSEPADLTDPTCRIPTPGPAFRIVVKDNGIGFDMRHLDRIFRVFQRLHSREEYEGSGIGLAICRSIVERHGGLITATSQPGSGSTFIIILPFRP